MNDNKKKEDKKATGISCERVYDGYFQLDRHIIEIDRHEGGKMQVERLMLERGDSVAILAYDPSRDQVLMVEQFSAGAFVNGDKPFGLTLPAGSINKSEDVIVAAQRELKEETGIDARGFYIIHSGVYASAGSSSERSALVLAIVDMSKAGGVHGAPGEQEDLKSVVMDASAFIAQAEQGGLRDLSSIAAAFHLARKRDQLRQAFNCAAKGGKAQPSRSLRMKRNIVRISAPAAI